MKTNLTKRVLSLALVLCFMVGMIAFAPVAGAEEPPISIVLVPYKLDLSTLTTTPLTETTVGTGDAIALELVISGYDQWEMGIDMAQFWIYFDSSQVNYFGAYSGSVAQMAEDVNPYLDGSTLTLREDSAGVAAAMSEEKTVYLYDAQYKKKGNAVTGYTYESVDIPQLEDFVLASYFFTLKTDDEIELTIPTVGDDFILGNSVGYDNTLPPTLATMHLFTNVNASTVTIPVPESWTVNGCTINGELPPVEYTIAYNANGGIGTMAPTVGTAPVVAANTFTRSGYTFNGWNTSADGSGTSYIAGDVISEDITLYAIWQKNTHTLTNFAMLGAQARVNANPGLRFGVNLDGIGGHTITKFGMIMIPTDLLDGAELTHDTPNYAEGIFNYVPGSYYAYDGGIVFTAVLINIPEGQEGRDITARSFIVIDGKYIYSDSMIRNFTAVLAAANLT